MFTNKIKIGIFSEYPLWSMALASLIRTEPEMAILVKWKVKTDLMSFLDQSLSTSIPDIILIDLNYEDILTGTDVTLYLKRNYPGIKIIIVAISKHPKIINGLLEIGAASYITKDDDQSLLKAIKAVYTDGEYVTAIMKEALKSPTALIGIQNPEEDLQLMREWQSLTGDEKEFLKQIHMDIDFEQMAENMGLNEAKFRKLRQHIYEKFKVETRVGLLLKCLIHGLILPEFTFKQNTS